MDSIAKSSEKQQTGQQQLSNIWKSVLPMQIQSLTTCTVNESAQGQKLGFQVTQFLIILFFQCTPTYYMVAEVLTSCKLWFFLLKHVDLIIFIFKCILHSVIHSTSKHKPVNNNPHLSNTKLSSSFHIIRLSRPLFQECSVLKKMNGYANCR